MFSYLIYNLCWDIGHEALMALTSVQKKSAFELRNCCALLTSANKTHTNLSIQVLYTRARADQSGAVNLTWRILHSILNAFTCCSLSFFYLKLCSSHRGHERAVQNSTRILASAESVCSHCVSVWKLYLFASRFCLFYCHDRSLKYDTTFSKCI